MKTINLGAGCHISEAARKLVAAAQEHGAATGTFNGIEIAADRTSTAEGVVADWDRRRTAAAEAYRASPAGIEEERQRNVRRSRLQQTHDALMRRLPKLDFTNRVAVLDWLCEMQDPSDHVGVITRRDTIISTFKRHGFEPGVNCGSDFRKGDADNEFRWLVGQALSTLETCAIHGIVHKFAAEWKEKFAREKALTQDMDA